MDCQSKLVYQRASLRLKLDADIELIKNTSRELDLLAELMRVCSKYNIKIQICTGTLLGAVRHNGFVPWDDDLDVCMTLEEYRRLRKVAIKEFAEPYFFQDGLTDTRYFFGFARLRNSLTTAAVRGFSTSDYNNGIFIDINILNVYPENYIADKVKILSLRLISRLIREHCGIRGLTTKTMIARFFYCLRPLIKCIPLKLFYALYHDIAAGGATKAKYVGLDYMTFCAASRRRYRVERRFFDETIWMDFETLKVPAPAQYDDLLRSMYGNYHAYPPISERGVWHDGEIEFDPEKPYCEYLMEKEEP